MLCIAGFDWFFKHLNRNWEQILGYKDGSYRWFLWNATSVVDQQLIYATAHDITEQKENEQRLAAQYGVTRVLAEDATLSETILTVLRMICEGVGWEFGALWAVDKHANLLRCSEIWHSQTLDVHDFVSVSDVMTFPPGIGLPGRVWVSREPAWIPDVIRDTNFPRMPIAATSGLHAAFAFPIIVDNEVAGVIEFFSKETRSPDGNLLKMMKALGSQIGLFIARKRVGEEREQLIGQLREALASVKTLSGMLPICATCNKIRDDQGAWHRIEDYISAHSAAFFTHGICTECARKQHPDWDEVK
jgi:transcriptional regulator with GAF, ATPase, and Fis domain